MNRMIGSVFLIAGTAIGAGMIALPMVLAKLGLMICFTLMMAIWFLIRYTALVGIELNLRAGTGLTLGQLGARFSGPIAQWGGVLGLTFLCFALLAAYINGSGSILANISHAFGAPLSQETWMYIVSIPLFLLLFYGIKIADYANRLLFGLMIVGTLLLIACLLPFIPFSHLPTAPHVASSLKSWTVALPVLFTSFGFHVIFHTISTYLNLQKEALKRVFLWGSLIPTSLYVAWTLAVLLCLNHNDPGFYAKMISSPTNVGELIDSLTHITQNPAIQGVIWVISLFAILTSILGVGIGLGEQLSHLFESHIPSPPLRRFCISFATLIPPLLIAILVPGAFIKALAFAGMILVVIAVFLPLWLLYKSDVPNQSAHYPLLDNKALRVLVLLLGSIIAGAEVLNIFGF